MILNIYKEKGWTSFDVIAKLRGILKIKKIGHAGTLDPLAEGVLVVLTGADTKKQDEYMHMEKEYLAEIAFGARSATYDMEGEITFSEDPLSLDTVKKEFETKISKYIGEYLQEVPPYSAVKVSGKKLYNLARAGTVDSTNLPKKNVSVKDIKVNNWQIKEISGKKLPIVTITIICASGFYVRSLAHDLGEDLKVGAVLVNLLRTKVGYFEVMNAQKITQDFPQSQN